ncbi:nuclear pore complex protein NUP98A-like [Pseudomyrmex gracilis]|uniref:nuclear pore complex protein NUP98A-like n=1 Tax=Pseudomyrmex gracilis TaxID=219809 RepID=UPI00099536B4|nr:nuclear pore complex protein NUP98A-like [Pseudomyrmex gracilis]
MTDTQTGDLKYFLPVIIFAYMQQTIEESVAPTVCSASASAYAGASALSNADAFAGTFGETGSLSGTHDGHKGIRSYGFPQGNDANRDTKSYNTPSAHDGAGHHHGIKDRGHDYNKNGDGCSKCKWENDDYWERDEPEEEEDEVDEDECDDGDDGQYRPGKHDHYGSDGANKGPKRRLQPPGVQKTGPTGVYTDDGIQAGGGVNPSSFSPNIPNTGYSKPTDNFGSTSKPGFGWNTPSVASKPGYGGVTTNAFATSSSWPNWQGGTTPSGFGTSPKPAWSDKHDGVPAGSYGTTPKPGTSWNTAPTGSNAPPGRFPSTPGAPQNTGHGFGVSFTGFPSTPPGKLGWNTGRDSTPVGSYGVTPKPESSWNTGHDSGNFGTTAKPVDTPGYSLNTGSSSKPGSNWNSGYGTTPVGTPGCTGSGLSCNQGNIPHGETPDFGKKEQPFGFNKPEYAQPSYVNKPQGPNQLPSNVNSGSYTPGVAPGVQSNVFSSGKLPTPTTFPTGSGSYPGVTKPNYGSGTNTWQHPGTTGSYAGFPASNTGFGTTKTPFNHVSTSSPVSSSGSFSGTGQKPGFSVASSSATASAGASAFGTSFGPHSTLGTSLHGTTPTHGSGSGYPGVKGHTKPSYGTTPHGTYPDTGSGTWSGKPSGSGSATWPEGQPGSYNRPSYGKPEDGSTPSKPLGGGPETYNRPLYSGKPEDGSTPSKPLGGGPGICYNRPSYGKPGDGSTPNKPLESGPGTWPSGQSGIKSHPSNYPGTGSGTWPGKQPGYESGCRSCGEVTSSHGGNSNCGSYNCGGCSGKDNTPTIHGCNQAVGGVNKTYYPAGTGDGNVPSIAEAYGPGSSPESLEKWNPQNPFLYGAGRPQSDVSRPWSETTTKPLGQGNPFLDFSSNNPKPAYSSASATDRNVIPYGEEDTKPIGQGNIFLDSAGGNIGNNPNEVPFGEKKPEGNVFLGFPGSVNSSPGSSSYGRPDGSSVPGTSGGNNSPSPAQCKLGIFGCGTSDSGSYGNNPQSVGTSSGVPGIVGSAGNPGSGIGSGHPGSIGGNLGHAGAFAGAFSSAQASSFANTGLGNDFGQGGNRPSSAGAQNQNVPNAWASSGASAFASSSSGSWSGNHPINVKG